MKEVIRYLIFGVLTTVVSLATYYVLTLTILDAENAFELQVANIVSWIISVTFAYVTNRKYVFESKDDNIFQECAKFFASRVFTLLVDMILMGVFVSWLKLDDKIMKLVDQAVIIALNYILSKLVVFRARKD